MRNHNVTYVYPFFSILKGLVALIKPQLLYLFAAYRNTNTYTDCNCSSVTAVSFEEHELIYFS